MKKKIVILGLSSVLAVSAIAASAVMFSRKAKSENLLYATDPEYMLVIDSPIYEGSAAEGSGLDNKIVKTSLGNDVKIEYNKLFEYEEGYRHAYATGVNCMKNGSYFAVVANSEGHGISGIKSVSITTDNDTYGSSPKLVGYYGWNDGDYVGAERKDTSDGDVTLTFTFGDTNPTFVKFEPTSDNAGNRVGVHEIVIEYTCVTSSNPYYVEGDYAYKMYYDHASVSVYTGTSTDLVIPDSVDGRPVTTIEEDFTFTNVDKADIVSVTLPASVDTIDGSAFKGASKLESINLENVEYIGDYAFYYAQSLEEVDLSSATQIGDYAFTNCTALTDIGSFDSIVSIGSHAFYVTNTLDDDLSFPATLSLIGNSAFMYSAIKSVTIDDDAVAAIEDAAFRNCTYLKTVYIGDNVYRCDDFTYDGVLESIVVGENNDDYCAVDNVLYYKESSNSWIGVRLAANRPQTTYVMPEKVTSLHGYFAYQSNTLESITFNDRIEETGDYGFSFSTNLTSITFGSAIEVVEDSFVGCTSLTSLHIPGTVEHIGQRAFNGCSGLETVIIDEGVQRLDKQAFAHCTSLTTVVIPSTLTSAGDKWGWDEVTTDVFDGCTALTSVFTALTSGGYATDPAGPIYDGFYGSRTLVNYSETYSAGCWHYNAGVPELW